MLIEKTDSQIKLTQDKTTQFASSIKNIEIKSYADKDINEDEFGCVKAYCHYVGDSEKYENAFHIQIRAKQAITKTSKPKSIIAQVNLTDSDIMQLAQFVIEKRKQYNTFSSFPLVDISEHAEPVNAPTPLHNG